MGGLCPVLPVLPASSRAPPLAPPPSQATPQPSGAALLACLCLPNSPHACCSRLLVPARPAVAAALPCRSAYNLSELVQLGVGGLQTSLGRALNKKAYQVSFDGKTKPVSEACCQGGLLPATALLLLLGDWCQRAAARAASEGGCCLPERCCLPEGCCQSRPARGGGRLASSRARRKTVDRSAAAFCPLLLRLRQTTAIAPAAPAFHRAAGGGHRRLARQQRPGACLASGLRRLAAHHRCGATAHPEAQVLPSAAATA